MNTYELWAKSEGISTFLKQHKTSEDSWNAAVEACIAAYNDYDYPEELDVELILEELLT